MNRLRIKCERTLLVIAALVSMGFAQLYASDATWKAAPTDGAWENTNNWVELAAPGATGTTTNPDTATFSTGSSTLTIVPDATRNLKSIIFGTSSVGAYTIGTTGGNALLLSDGGAIQTLSTVANTETINAPLLLQGSYAFTNGASSSSRLLNFGGAISGTAASGSTNTLTIAGANTGANTLGGSISNGAGGGVLALSKYGAGRWNLSGANTHSGGTTLNAGTLSLNNNAALGLGVFTINGGTLTTDAARTLAGVTGYVWNGSFAKTYNAPTLNLGTAPLSLVGDVTVTLTRGQYDSNDITLGGIVSGGGALTVGVAGGYSGTLTLSVSNTFSGGITLNNGTLGINNNYALGKGPMRFNGGGLLVVNGTVIANTNILYLKSMSSSSYQRTLDLGQGPMVLTADATINVGRNVVTVRRPITDGGNNYKLTFSSGDSYQDDYLYLNGTNTFSGGVSIWPIASNGYEGKYLCLNIGYLGTDATASALGTGTLRILASTSATKKLLPMIDNTSGADGTLATANPQIWDNNLAFRGTKSLNMGNGSISLGTSAGTTRTVTVLDKTLTIGGVISNGTTANILTKAGAGTLALSGANSYTGGTVVAAGTLSVETTGTLSTGAVTVAPGATLVLKNGEAIAGDAVVTLQNAGASYGKINLSEGVVEKVGSVVLGATTYTTPGMMFDAVGYPSYFLGTGQLKITAPSVTLIVVK